MLLQTAVLLPTIPSMVAAHSRLSTAGQLHEDRPVCPPGFTDRPRLELIRGILLARRQSSTGQPPEPVGILDLHTEYHIQARLASSSAACQ